MSDDLVAVLEKMNTEMREADDDIPPMTSTTVRDAVEDALSPALEIAQREVLLN